MQTSKFKLHISNRCGFDAVSARLYFKTSQAGFVSVLLNCRCKSICKKKSRTKRRMRAALPKLWTPINSSVCKQAQMHACQDGKIIFMVWKQQTWNLHIWMTLLSACAAYWKYFWSCTRTLTMHLRKKPQSPGYFSVVDLQVWTYKEMQTIDVSTGLDPECDAKALRVC